MSHTPTTPSLSSSVTRSPSTSRTVPYIRPMVMTSWPGSRESRNAMAAACCLRARLDVNHITPMNIAAMIKSSIWRAHFLWVDRG